MVVDLENHASFRREGSDLYYDLDLSFPQAALGAEIEIPVLGDGKQTKLRVPAGVQPGDQLVAPREGVPRLDGRGRGDLIAVVHIQVPRKLNSRAKELLLELQKSFESDA